MLTEQTIRESSARRTGVLLPVMVGAVGAVFVYFLGAGRLQEPLTSLAAARFGEPAAELAVLALIVPAFAIFLVPSLLAASYVSRFRTECPSCGADVSSRTKQVLATRCCPACRSRVVAGGRSHSAAVYRRYVAVQSRAFLRTWFWAWPALGVIVLVWHTFDRSAFDRCPQGLWIAPLVGAATAGWAWLRTGDRRYLPQLVASAIVLGLGVELFWK